MYSSFLLRRVYSTTIAHEHFRSEYIPTNGFQKTFLAIGSAFMSLYDPHRQDMVAALGDVTSLHALRRVRQQMLQDECGRQILHEKPTISTKSISLSSLRQLSDGTFGREYVRFLEKNGISPDTRTPVRFIENEELAYLMRRYREIHDFWHVLCQVPITVEGEVALKWFEFAHGGFPVALLSGLVGPSQISCEQRVHLIKTFFPWAIQAGYRARPLMNVYYERHFDMHIDDLRKALLITPSPFPFYYECT